MPPDGEFALINYRTTHGFKPPFRLHTTIEADPITNTKALLTLRLWCEVRGLGGASTAEALTLAPRT